ncbi:MAG: sugar ABC transporter permease [Deltaproteobacteria bacterium]|nr:MAG: sugar ABC transporter permease [Deltaproteobacteria bacterium]
MKGNQPSRHTLGTSDEGASFAFALPLALLLLLFAFLPLAGTLLTSLFRDTTFLEKKFIFLANYSSLFRDRSFFQSLTFTLAFIATSVPLEIALGFLFSLVVHENVPALGFFRVALILPWAVPAAVSGRVWELIYSYSHGIANTFLLKLGIISHPVNWLGTETGAFFSLVFADVWKTTPFVAIILLAGLQSIPSDIHRQASVDGAGPLRRLFTITLPMLKPSLVVALLFRTIDALRVFDVVYVLTKGGPGGTTTSLSLYAYRYYVSGDFGYGSAVSVVLFFCALALSILYLRASRFREVLA